MTETYEMGLSYPENRIEAERQGGREGGRNRRREGRRNIPWGI